jgi:hypothetical protein
MQFLQQFENMAAMGRGAPHAMRYAAWRSPSATALEAANIARCSSASFVVSAVESSLAPRSGAVGAGSPGPSRSAASSGQGPAMRVSGPSRSAPVAFLVAP